MEEIFEIIAGIATIVAVIVGAAKKNAKKAKKPSRKNVNFEWGDLDNQVTGEPIIPYAPVDTAQPQHVQLEMNFEPAPEPEHPSQQAVEGPKKPRLKIAPVADASPAQDPASAAYLTAAKLREAVIMSEILGKPAALRRNSGRI